MKTVLSAALVAVVALLVAASPAVAVDEPLTFALAFDSQAVVDEKTGVAVVTGSLTCSRDVESVSIVVDIFQELGNSPGRVGSGRATVSCTANTANPFSVQVLSRGFPEFPGLSDGPATVRMQAIGCDATACGRITASGDLQLVKKLK